MTGVRMMTRVLSWLLFAALAGILLGCGSGASYTKVPDFKERELKFIAVVPFSAGGADEAAVDEIRKMIQEGLYFKGYPKVPLTMVDERLREAYPSDGTSEKGTVSPEAAGRLLGVDAVLYGWIDEWKTSSLLFYTPTTIRVTLALRSAKTGEELWRSSCEVVRRTCGFPGRNLKVKSVIDCDEALDEAVGKTLSGFPDGPDAVGMAAQKRGFFQRWWPFGS